jgi:hypothetical protein
LIVELCPMHKGQVIEKAVRASGVPLTQLARRLNRSRQWVYNIFHTEQVSLDVAIEIGKIIHYDFSKEFKQLKGYTMPEENNMFEEENPEDWKTKCIHLLEEKIVMLNQIDEKNQQMRQLVEENRTLKENNSNLTAQIEQLQAAKK